MVKSRGSLRENLVFASRKGERSFPFNSKGALRSRNEIILGIAKSAKRDDIDNFQARGNASEARVHEYWGNFETQRSVDNAN